MRVLFVIESMPCHRFLKEAQALHALGIELYMCYRKRGATIAKDADFSIFKSILTLKKRERFFKKKLLQFIADNQIEVIHYHNYPDRLGFQLLNYGLKIPLIYDQHDLMSIQKTKFNRKKKYWEQYCLENADGVVFVTEHYQKKSFELYNIEAPYIVLPNLTSQNVIKEIATPEKKLSGKDGNIHLVWVGHINSDETHHKCMLRSFKVLSERGFHIHVYPTRSKEYHDYREIANVHLHDQLSYEDMMEKINNYDAGIAINNPYMPDKTRMHTLLRVFQNKLNDYIFAGIPAITLNSFEPMADYINKYEVGFTFDTLEEMTPEMIRDKMPQYLTNISEKRPVLLKKINQQVEEMIALYHDLKEKKQDGTS